MTIKPLLKSIFLFFLLVDFFSVGHAQTFVPKRYSNRYINAMVVANWEAKNGQPARFAVSKLKKWHRHPGFKYRYDNKTYSSRPLGAVVFFGESSEGIWHVHGGYNNDASESVKISLVLTGFDGKQKKEYNLISEIEADAESDEPGVFDKMLDASLKTLWSLARSKEWPIDTIKPFQWVSHQNGPEGFVWSVYGDDYEECLARLVSSKKKNDLCFNFNIVSAQHVYDFGWSVQTISKDKPSYNYTVLAEP